MKNKLLPLEYCRIGRAARLLGCEESDLLHWGAIRAIKLWASFDGYNGLAFVIDGERTNRTADYPGIGIDDYTINHVASYTLMEERESDICIGLLSGFWALNPEHLDVMERHQVVPESLWFSAKDQNGKNVWAVIDGEIQVIRSEDVETEAFMSKAKNPSYWLSDSGVGDLWVMRDDLELAHQHIHSGAPLTKNTDDDVMPAQAKIHPNAERFAATREKVLAAGIYVMKKWPNELDGTAVKLAEVVSNHEGSIFDGAASPLAVEKMERIFSTAMTSGEPHKST